MKVDWPDELVAAIARRRSVLFLGAGISHQATNTTGQHPPMWAEFLEKATAKVQGPEVLRKEITRLIRRRDFLTACEVIKGKLGATFEAVLSQEFLTPAFQAADIHTSITKLDSRIVATPNYDKIYETHINHLQSNSVVTKNYYDPGIAASMPSPSRLVLKVHGTIDNPQQMIFTRSEYAEARHKYRSFYAILEALAVTHTFLFLGCGLDDPDIRLVLEDHAFLHQYSAPHYFVLPKNSVHKCIRPAIEHSLNVSILTYDSAGQHALLKDSIDDLVLLVNEKRIELIDSANW
ncbi:MAG: SIR2 family protein [Chloroflexi bacterium]|nr:SIR2 family protein [Chloroflexota bacterium]